MPADTTEHKNPTPRDFFASPKRYLVAVADDMGRSSSINQAIAHAHDTGILGAASLMAGGEAFDEAVHIARKRANLSVGLHVTLCDGHAVLPHSRIPDLSDVNGCLEESPSVAWMRCMRRSLLPQIEAEVEAQFERLERAGIRPSHVDGHHHLHMHPLIFELLCRQASQRGVSWIRLTGEPLAEVVRSLPTARGAMPFVEWAVFGVIRPHNLQILRRYGLHTADRVYGLSRTGAISEKYLLDTLGHMTATLNELFAHPDMASQSGLRELEALTSPRVRDRLVCLGILQAGYDKLLDNDAVLSAECKNL